MRFLIDPNRSTVVVAARSSMGPIAFQSRNPTGWIDAEFRDGEIVHDPGPSAELAIDLGSLSSGNEVYDAELRRRIEARRFPTCELSLSSTASVAPGRYSLAGDIRFHGISRPVRGNVSVTSSAPDVLVVTGEKMIDIRDFDIPAPSMLMLKIYPDVDVHLFIEARCDPDAGEDT